MKVSDTMVIKAQTLPAKTKPADEVTALTRAFQLTKGQSLNLYTDSNILHILLSRVAVWKKHGLLTTKERSITSSDQIVALLEASLSHSHSVILCRSHQASHFVISQGK